MGTNGMRRAHTGILTIVLLLAAVLPRAARSQAVLPDRDRSSALQQNVFGLGFSAGPATGIGLSFRHHLPSAVSYQITGGIIKVDDRLLYTLGGEVQADLVRGAQSRFFAGGGFGYYHSGRSGKNDLTGPARLSVGIGGEIHLGSGIHAAGELLFVYFSDGNVLPLPQVALFYYFY